MDNPARVSKRVAFRNVVKYGTQKPPEFVSFITDLSDTGVCIKTNKVFTPGTRLYMVIELGGSVFNAEGTVVWAKKAPPGLVRHVKTGMGIRFTHADEGLLRLYHEKKEV
ncbi:MAG: PilZ domain-containing protein [Deltaproteobacteria bacterium]|nr:PilZ domain-containing protein [Deltaproteobacteria bacterium]